MGLVFKYYKRRFRSAIEPLFVMLIAKMKEHDRNDWLQLVDKTKQRIVNNPVDFLGNDLPESNSQLRDIVDEIFSEFLRESARRKPFVTK